MDKMGKMDGDVERESYEDKRRNSLVLTNQIYFS